MKSLITALVIAALLGVGSEVHMRRLERASWELAALNGDVREAIDRGDIEDAIDSIDALIGRMDDAEMFFGAMGDHEEIDKININIAELRGHTEAGDLAEASARCRVLSYLFGHLPDNSRLKIQNIL